MPALGEMREADARDVLIYCSDHWVGSDDQACDQPELALSNHRRVAPSDQPGTAKRPDGAVTPGLGRTMTWTTLSPRLLKSFANETWPASLTSSARTEPRPTFKLGASNRLGPLRSTAALIGASGCRRTGGLRKGNSREQCFPLAVSGMPLPKGRICVKDPSTAAAGVFSWGGIDTEPLTREARPAPIGPCATSTASPPTKPPSSPSSA